MTVQKVWLTDRGSSSLPTQAVPVGVTLCVWGGFLCCLVNMDVTNSNPFGTDSTVTAFMFFYFVFFTFRETCTCLKRSFVYVMCEICTIGKSKDTFSDSSWGMNRFPVILMNLQNSW